jgi:crotonobetaine/carnitine-CoA ligase
VNGALAPTLARRWRDSVAARGDREFLTFEDRGGGVTMWSYDEWDRLVARTAAYLAESGAGPGARVHVALANSPAFVAVWLACIRLGAVLVLADPRATTRELNLQLVRTRPVVGVCGLERADVYRAAAPSDLAVLEVDEDDTELAAWSDTAPAPTELPPAASPAAILFTSGTTSDPKGVVITQANYAFAGDVMAAAAMVGPDDRLLVVLPLFHANAQYYSFAAAICAGASVCLMPAFSATRFTLQAARHRATHASLFAAPIRMILARGGDPVEGLRLRHCWYAQNVAAEQLDSFERIIGCRPRQLYGMTETIPAVIMQRRHDGEPGVIGEPALGCDVDLRDPDTGDLTATGDTGEITVGGAPGHVLFAGYLDDEATTADAFRDGRFRTGDLATADAGGQLRFAGRRGDVLKVSGENVSTVEVEAVLDAHPGVLEVAIVGRPDPIRDEVPVAFVVRAAGGEDLDEATLLAYAGERLAPAKRPRAVHFVHELPRTSVGKIRKFLLSPAGP